MFLSSNRNAVDLIEGVTFGSNPILAGLRQLVTDQPQAAERGPEQHQRHASIRDLRIVVK